MTRKAKNGDERVENGNIVRYSEATGRFEEAGTVTEYRAEQRRIRNSTRGGGEPAEWRSANPTELLRLVVAVTKLGFAVRFGYTRDGGAFAIGVIGDGEPFTEFVRSTEDIDLFLRTCASDYEKAPDNEFAAKRHV